MPGQVVAVWGPTGAPGRTTVAISVATTLALGGSKVLLVDADTYGGAVAGYLELFDEAPGFLAASRLAPTDELSREEFDRLSHLCKLGKQQIHVLTGIANTARWPELSPARVRACLTALREWFEYIIVDVGFNLEEDEEIVSDLMSPRRNQATVTVLKESDVVVTVAHGEVVGLSRFIHNLESLRVVIDTKPVVHVVNRLRRTGALSGAGTTVRSTLHRFAGIDHVHLIDEDIKNFDAATVAAVPIVVSAPHAAVSKQIRELAGLVTQACTRARELALC